MADQSHESSNPHGRRSVTIFGAGVTGLTAAHELIERGFQVEVWEVEADERVPARGCTVGGMARTQWSAVDWPERFVEPPQTPDWRQAQARPIEVFDQEFYLLDGGFVSNFMLLDGDVDPDPQLVQRDVNALLDQLRAAQTEAATPALVYAECLRLSPVDGTSTNSEGQGDLSTHSERAALLVERLFPNARRSETHPDHVFLDDPPCAFIVRSLPTPEPAPDPRARIVVRFRRRERWLPGEHGYRFFPSFYSHLFETMQRTPLLDPKPKLPLNKQQEQAEGVHADDYYYVESGRTVFDNLIPAKAHALAFDDDHAPLTFPRHRLGSLTAIIRHWRVAMERLGFSPRDTVRYGLRLQEYALMSPDRRRQLESISWWTFVGGDDPGYYSPRFRDQIARWSEGLVAMDAEACDARTFGSVILQLIFDQYRGQSDYRDGILNGPTSEAWLDPWRRYLEAQGVRFIHGKLLDLEYRDERFRAKVECFEPRYPGALDNDPQLLDGQIILALPVDEVQRIAERFIKEYEASNGGDKPLHSDLWRVARPLHDNLEEDLKQPRPRGPLRHFAGIQYYFMEDLSWVHGHIYYPDAPWGLSSISQARFWQEKHDWEHGYRGLMSVILSTWDARSPYTGKTAWESAPHELAQEVWRQLKVALLGTNDRRLGEIDADAAPRLPDPIFWRLDKNMTWTNPGYANSTPFQINLPGKFNDRPGDLKYGYRTDGGLTLAGTFMRTYTRLTTMEAANESARHAVNALLRTGMAKAGMRQSKLCKIFPIEHREPQDLGFVKKLDAAFAKKEAELGETSGRSLVEALGIDRWTAFMPKER